MDAPGPHIDPAPWRDRRVLVSGGAGFLGSHLVEVLVQAGARLTVVDNLVTGSWSNLAAVDGPVERVEGDVVDVALPDGPWDHVIHMASPASPPAYQAHPLLTLRVGSAGTDRLCQLAHGSGATFTLLSTSEVYGTAAEHPQTEAYWGHVNPVGPRSMYDEAKRFAEALATAWAGRGLRVRIARIFNTYGPRMGLEDGRVIPNFGVQGLRGEPLTLYGDGQQTRSFCYVSDLVEGLCALATSGLEGPVNLGNPDERTIAELADVVEELTRSRGGRLHRPMPVDDPVRRCPDITRAREGLGWSPRVDLATGMRATLADMAARIGVDRVG